MGRKNLRFLVMNYENAVKAGCDMGRYSKADWWRAYLVDTHKARVVGADCLNQEDATLYRDFDWVASAMEELARER